MVGDCLPSVQLSPSVMRVFSSYPLCAVGVARCWLVDGGMSSRCAALRRLFPFSLLPLARSESRGHTSHAHEHAAAHPLAMRTHKGLLLTWYNHTHMHTRTLATSDLQRGRGELNAPSGCQLVADRLAHGAVGGGLQPDATTL